ncbi:MAG: S41 family peptidase [Erysipelotrichaceae bacterium]|nr:S41 family peptidase [Erysipelotrichaceae bacterium]
MEDKKVRIQLQRHLWPDEIEERRHRRRSRVMLIVMLVCTFVLGMVVGGNVLSTVEQVPVESTVSSKLDSVYSILKNNWYFGTIDENVDQHLIDRALYGMATSEEDPHTTYMSSEELASFTTSIDMGFVGIGVQYTTADNLNMITRVFHNSPAEKSGVLPGDIIYRVDGVLVSEMDPDVLPDAVKGEEGTPVVIEFLRDNEVIEKTILRGAVQNTAYGEMLEGNIGYLEIYQFGSSTGAEVKEYLSLMSKQGLKSLVLDLRDNTGGYLDAYVSVVSMFVDEGITVMKQIYSDGSEETSVSRGGKFSNIEDIVILVNGNTASASEVLTVALKELRDDVTVLGTTTYGKGTVQVTHTFRDGSALKYTTSKWVSPNGVWVNGTGIEPDIYVDLPSVLYYSYARMEDGEQYELDSVSAYTQIAQEALAFIGVEVSRTDGYFDQGTKDALIQFQKEFECEQLGVLDTETFEALLSQVTKKWSIEKEADIQLQSALDVLR